VERRIRARQDRGDGDQQENEHDHDEQRPIATLTVRQGRHRCGSAGGRFDRRVGGVGLHGAAVPIDPGVSHGRAARRCGSATRGARR
jgi:hypothetical protein